MKRPFFVDSYLNRAIYRSPPVRWRAWRVLVVALGVGAAAFAFGCGFRVAVDSGHPLAFFGAVLFCLLMGLAMPSSRGC